MTNLLTIDRLHSAYAEGRDPADVVAAVFDAIAAADDPGIFLALVDRGAAEAAARALGPFDPVTKPLWGIPFAVKDNIDVAGMPTTAGCPGFAYVAEKTAFAVERLIAAGAILIGKTNLDQFATGLVGVRTPYPVPRNAMDPALVPGGSSSGSAVAVARGLVTVALGTDTAGSGRVPAALNNIVGLKPSVGAVSAAGVVPACRTLDCISVFALTVHDAWRAYETMAVYDVEDAYARPIELGRPALPASLRVGIPNAGSREFYGDAIAAAAFRAALGDLTASGVPVEIVEIDLAPFRDVAELLYAGPWVAERYQAIRDCMERRAEDLHPTTRAIIGKAPDYTAADAFAGQYRLADLRRRTESVWTRIDYLLVPTIPTLYTLADLAADPFTPNARLGTYTNFVNLLDLAALTVPGRFREDGRPAGVTLIGPRGSDAGLAALGARLHEKAGLKLGATAFALPPAAATAAVAKPPGWIEVVVVGAHMSGLPLNRELTALGGVHLRSGKTEATYRLYALPGGPPHRPGLIRVAPDGGAAIETEVWALSPAAFGTFVSGIPQPLGIGTVQLADGTRPKGFLVEAVAVDGAEDITALGGWRAFVARRA